MTDPSIAQLPGLAAIAGDHRGILCDVWGVVHNGVTAFAPACAALANFRAAGGVVVLVTNAPRPAPAVARQIAAIGVPDAAFDAIVTSGDTTRDLLLEEKIGRLYHLGPDRDLPLFEGLAVDRVVPEDAEIVVCTGLFDEHAEKPEDYRPHLRDFAARGLRLVCANPDIVVEVDGTLYWCAGALAREYAALGGEVVMLGKPHPPIYRAAMARLRAAARGAVAAGEVLAIGDGLSTDIAGATDQGMPALFISSGIHAADFGDVDAPDPQRIADRLRAENAVVVGTMPRLRW